MSEPSKKPEPVVTGHIELDSDDDASADEGMKAGLQYSNLNKQIMTLMKEPVQDALPVLLKILRILVKDRNVAFAENILKLIDIQEMKTVGKENKETSNTVEVQSIGINTEPAAYDLSLSSPKRKVAKIRPGSTPNETCDQTQVTDVHTQQFKDVGVGSGIALGGGISVGTSVDVGAIAGVVAGSGVGVGSHVEGGVTSKTAGTTSTIGTGIGGGFSLKPPVFQAVTTLSKPAKELTDRKFQNTFNAANTNLFQSTINQQASENTRLYKTIKPRSSAAAKPVSTAVQNQAAPLAGRTQKQRRYSWNPRAAATTAQQTEARDQQDRYHQRPSGSAQIDQAGSFMDSLSTMWQNRNTGEGNLPRQFAYSTGQSQACGQGCNQTSDVPIVPSHNVGIYSNNMATMGTPASTIYPQATNPIGCAPPYQTQHSNVVQMPSSFSPPTKRRRMMESSSECCPGSKPTCSFNQQPYMGQVPPMYGNPAGMQDVNIPRMPTTQGWDTQMYNYMKSQQRVHDAHGRHP